MSFAQTAVDPSSLFLVILFGEDGQHEFPGAFLLQARPPRMHEWISNSHAEGTSPSMHCIIVIIYWGRSLGVEGVDRNRFRGERNDTAGECD